MCIVWLCRPKLLWEEIEEPSINDEEFMSLFSRQVVEKKAPKKKIEKISKVQVCVRKSLKSFFGTFSESYSQFLCIRRSQNYSTVNVRRMLEYLPPVCIWIFRKLKMVRVVSFIKSIFWVNHNNGVANGLFHGKLGRGDVRMDKIKLPRSKRIL